MNEHEVRIGVVGAGYWGPNLIRNCAELGVLDSVCDINEAALAATRQAFPTVTTLTDFSALLRRRINAVIIASPAHLHASMALQAITAGKHVFVEKPLALSLEEGRKVEDAAQTAGVLVFVGHLLLYHPAVTKIRSLIAEGVIGDLWHVRSRRTNLGKLRSHENVWWSFAPHDVALVLAIFGEEPRSVISAQTFARDNNICDVAYADYEFSGGRSAHVEVCWLDPDRSARLDIFGTRGVVCLSDSRNSSAVTLRPFKISQNEQGSPIAIPGEPEDVAFDPGEPLKLELKAFIDSITTGRKAETDATQGVAVLKALYMADITASQRVNERVIA
jgi:UDP-2-acetamido-3-amino-2,3-dideoxy-glucuronate N-acetyltransferase